MEVLLRVCVEEQFFEQRNVVAEDDVADNDKATAEVGLVLTDQLLAFVPKGVLRMEERRLVGKC